MTFTPPFLNRTRSTWKFEYTGDPEPQVESLWGEDPLPEIPVGSTGYKNMMTTDVLNTAAFTSTQHYDENMMEENPFTLPVRTVPTNATPDEILATVKGSMYRVSGWLLQMEKADARRREVLDSDLYEDQSIGTGYHGDFAPPPESYNRNDEEDEDDDERDDERDERDGDDLPGYEHYDREEDGELREGDRNMRRKRDGELPAYKYEGGRDDDDNDNDSNHTPPPTYQNNNQSYPKQVPSHRTDSSMRNSSSKKYRSLRTSSSIPPPIDRVTVIFKAFVRAQNNKARWLGSNDKLTRLKFHGGMERVLRLKMNWQQFDAMWNKLDSKRSGDLDIEEFKFCFGDIEEFATLEGIQIFYIIILISFSLSLQSLAEES